MTDADRAALVERSRLQQRWLDATAEIRAELLSGGPDEDVLRLVAQRTLELTRSTTTVIALGPSTEGGFTVHVAAGTGDGIVDALEPGHPLLKGVVEGKVAQLAWSAAGGPAAAVPLRAQRAVIGVLVAARRAGAEPFHPSEMPVLTSFAEQATLVLELAAKNRTQRQLSVCSDRDRIARDLHDHVIQRLFATGLQLQSTVRRSSNPEVQQRIRQAVDDLDTTVREIRSVIFDLQTAGDDGRVCVRRRLLDSAAEAASGSGIVPSVRISGPVDTLVTPEVATHVVAVVHEAIGNAVRHGHAGAVTLTVEAGEDLLVEVRDDGVGIEPEHAGRGLHDLADRARACGGELTVRRDEPAGTRVTWRVPSPGRRGRPHRDDSAGIGNGSALRSKPSRRCGADPDRQDAHHHPASGALMSTVAEPVTTTVRAACPQDCPDTCAMLVTVEDGTATRVIGDPDHPFTRGGLCVKVNNYLDRVYDQGRVLFPMRRTGPKGSGRFERISWDAALDEIATRFRAIADEHGPEAIMPVSYLGTQGILNGLNVGDPFFAKLGATISERTYCDSGSCTAYAMTIGDTAGVDPESLVHSRFILVWACNVMSTNLHLWPFIAEARKRGAKVVVVDPVRTRTAAAADQHIALRPGTDGALALAMANVIIAEGLTDDAYLAAHAVGFPEFAERVAQYTPEWAAAETGIEADTIRTLAREYAAAQPSVIRIGVAVERHAGGGQTVRALSCLPALVGAWRKPGGGILQLPLWAFPVNWGAFMHPEMLTPGTRIVNQYLLGDALTGGMALDPPLKALMVYNSNPVVVCPDQDKLIAGLSREDLFTVVSEQFMTDTAEYADIVLPATTQLEQDDIMFSWGHLYVTYNERAIDPIGEAVPNTELFRRLAARMGFTEPVFRRTDQEMIAEAFDWSHPNMAGITVESLRAQGWQRLSVAPAEDYAPHVEGNFPTASGKVEFVASAAAGGNFVVPLFRQGSNEYQPGQPVDPLPHYIPPRESAHTNPELAARYPLNLLTPKAHAYLNSSFGNLAFHRRAQKEPNVIIHPADAANRGIDDGVPVRIFNDRGSFVVLAKLDDAVLRGVVVSSVGGWRMHSKAAATLAAVNSTAFADLGNAPTFSDTLVEVELA